MQTFVPYRNGDVDRTESEGTCKVNRIGSTQPVHDGELTGHALDISREFDRTMAAIATRCRESGANFRRRETARQCGVAPVSQLCGHVGSRLVEHEFDESARVEIDDGHLQRRCSLTMSATGCFGFGRDRPPAIGRADRAGRLITPWAVRPSMTDVESSATMLFAHSSRRCATS